MKDEFKDIDFINPNDNRLSHAKFFAVQSGRAERMRLLLDIENTYDSTHNMICDLTIDYLQALTKLMNKGCGCSTVEEYSGWN